MKKQSPTKNKDNKSNSIFKLNPRLHLIILFLASFLIYSNTLTHEYTQDDAIVIYDNMFTNKGISGIPGLLKYDTFYGFFKKEGKAKLVSGGRYRPFTPIMFAVERQFFGKNPFWGHFFNVLWFSLLVIVLYKVLEKLFLHQKENQSMRNIIFLACLIYALHPVHTEVVANIKGRDEIICLLGSITSLYFTFKAFDNKKFKYTLAAIITGFIALMSKENAITFLAVIPLSLVFFRDSTWGNAFKKTGPFFIATIIFMIIRTSVLGMDFGDKSMELMNNPFIKISGNQYIPFSSGEWFATITFIMGKYLQLLFIPHPLTHDYYPRHIDIMNFGNWQVWASLISYIGLFYLMFKIWTKNNLIAWAIFFFIATISIVSNIVFPIGTNMSERFLFMPSVGFVLILSYLIFKLPKRYVNILSIGVLLLFSIKTFTRNMVWKSDFTLFTTDVKTSTKSAKVLNAAGGALSSEAFKEKNENKKAKMLRQSIGYLNESIKIHPNYKNAYLIRGNDYYYLKEYEKAIKSFESALLISPDYEDAQKNLAVTLRDKARILGEKENNLSKAIQYLERSISIRNNDPETFRLLAISYGISGNHPKAIENFRNVTTMTPQNAAAFANLSSAYGNAGMMEEAQNAQNKALKLDPKVYEKIRSGQ